MNIDTWLTPNWQYGRKLLRSAVDGAHRGEEEYLGGKSLHLFVDQSAWQALKPAALAGFLGALGAYSGHRRRSPARALTYGVLGGTIAFGAALAWESRGLTASIASAAWKRISRTRDEHWLEQHPIDYA